MGLESTMIVVDTSEWMRNGDYVPSRIEAQCDAVNLLITVKTNANPESTVGILAMSPTVNVQSKTVSLLASPTDNVGKLLNVVHKINPQSIGGTVQFSEAIQVAQLALKHRRNKKGSARIVVFLGSPIDEDDKALIKIGKLCKKNNIGVDVVSMGDVDLNANKLQVFVDAANSNQNSHLITVPAGVLPSDVLVTSPVFNADGDNSMGGQGSTSNDFAEYGGVDPNMDPDLALALRVSMEEERARQEVAAKKAAEEAAKSEPLTPIAETPPVVAEPKAPAPPAPVKAEEPAKAKDTPTVPSPTIVPTSTPPAVPTPAPASSMPFMDPSFVNSLLSGLPGVDPNDPKIQAAMKQITKKDEDKDDKKE
ncbi:26S proteasome non-ATPase regulatory subunit [Thraustotheca clavata]|uniref:26S proteasome regulatory subunit RPN10 n=1 Tax=Thraustotheca clavata TaxID=74557 RepID=A0A1W0A750_9STRA|nr:26S proteasome non-ATPase regulatory subunit [Thraustotheca clavata]